MNPVISGQPSPLGATVLDGGVNFSLFSRTATGVELLFFDREDDATPSRVVPLDPVDEPHLPLLARVRARREARATLRLSRRTGRPTRSAACGSTRRRCCSIPTAAASSCRRATRRDAARGPGDNAATAMKSVVVDPAAYDWEGDAPLRRPSARTIIYEMHVRGFTRHPNSGVDGADCAAPTPG